MSATYPQLAYLSKHGWKFVNPKGLEELKTGPMSRLPFSSNHPPPTLQFRNAKSKTNWSGAQEEIKNISQTPRYIHRLCFISIWLAIVHRLSSSNQFFSDKYLENFRQLFSFVKKERGMNEWMNQWMVDQTNFQKK